MMKRTVEKEDEEKKERKRIKWETERKDVNRRGE